jgi:hypothetical protein
MSDMMLKKTNRAIEQAKELIDTIRSIESQLLYEGTEDMLFGISCSIFDVIRIKREIEYVQSEYDKMKG